HRIMVSRIGVNRAEQYKKQSRRGVAARPGMHALSFYFRLLSSYFLLPLLFPETDLAPRSRHRSLAARGAVGAELVVERVLSAGLGLLQRTIDVDLRGVGRRVGDCVDPHGCADGVGGQRVATLDLVECAWLLDRNQVPRSGSILEGLLQADSVAGQAVDRDRS